MKILLEHGAHPDASTWPGRTPLINASRVGHEQIVRLLLHTGVEINALDDFRQCALSMAAEKGRTGVVRMLLAQEGIDLDPCNERDREIGSRQHSPLIWAIDVQHVGIVRLLLDKGTRPGEIADETNLPALTLAIDHGNPEIVRMLLDHGAADNMIKCDDNGPLLEALKRDDDTVIEMLQRSYPWGSSADLYGLLGKYGSRYR